MSSSLQLLRDFCGLALPALSEPLSSGFASSIFAQEDAITPLRGSDMLHRLLPRVFRVKSTSAPWRF